MKARSSTRKDRSKQLQTRLYDAVAREGETTGMSWATFLARLRQDVQCVDTV